MFNAPVPLRPTVRFPVVVTVAPPLTVRVGLVAGTPLLIWTPTVCVRAPLPEICRVPPLTVVVPIYGFDAVRVSVPAPVLVSAPVWALPVCRGLAKVTLFPLVSTVAVTPSSIFSRLEMS